MIYPRTNTIKPHKSAACSSKLQSHYTEGKFTAIETKHTHIHKYFSRKRKRTQSFVPLIYRRTCNFCANSCCELCIRPINIRLHAANATRPLFARLNTQCRVCVYNADYYCLQCYWSLQPLIMACVSLCP